MKKLWLGMMVLLIVGTGMVPAAQATLVLDLNTGGLPTSCGTCGGTNGDTFGWAFTVLSTITVDAIGVWDAGADGIGTPSPAGIWTAAGTLLASATITDSSTPVASASSDGDWLFEPIPSLTLTPGDYVIGNVFFAAVPLAQVGAPFVTIPEITGIAGRQGPFDSGLQVPLDPFIPIFGPTLQLTAIPEPTTLLLLGTGVIGLLAAAWRRRQRAA